ncbi:hypothetical protein [Pedobacter gandavensis]|uniref:hypothetical protein n=1 Tax=Pedobacter gandavensis TaxID=2679963 RepID=UPI00292DB67E|nr:hypothetical protein [Pedobacter gandavensis]
MKKTVILCTALFFLIGSLSVSANNDPNLKRETTLLKKNKSFVKISGPASVSLTGGPYTYEASDVPTSATNLRWVVMGNPRLEFPASDPENGKTAITLNGSDFGATGQQFVYLIGEIDSNPGIIISASVYVTN